jgi:hypothetical protein
MMVCRRSSGMAPLIVKLGPRWRRETASLDDYIIIIIIIIITTGFFIIDV